MYNKRSFSKRFLIAASTFVVFAISSYGQQYGEIKNPSVRYISSPGFVNITEFNGAIGLGDTTTINSKYYFGVTDVLGYQINRNFFGGVGIGYLHYDGGDFFPLYLEYKYSMYLRRITPYFYADGGVLIDPIDFRSESKIFINPGIGISRYISTRLECNFSVGLMIQAKSTVMRDSFINFKLGIIFRKNPFTMFMQK
jgi:hypothetical protein